IARASGGCAVRKLEKPSSHRAHSATILPSRRAWDTPRSRPRGGCSIVTRILPSIARLSSAPIERRHAPASGGDHARAYEQFRPCLRWEFTFSCAFCLLHEAQVCPEGAAGSSQFWIEHLELQSERPDLRNSYANLVYTCRRCNLARRSRSRVDARGRR